MSVPLSLSQKEKRNNSSCFFPEAVGRDGDGEGYVACGLQTAATYRQKHLLDESMCSVTLLYDSASEQMGYELVLDRYISQADILFGLYLVVLRLSANKRALWLVYRSGRSTICLMAVSMDNARISVLKYFLVHQCVFNTADMLVRSLSLSLFK